MPVVETSQLELGKCSLTCNVKRNGVMVVKVGGAASAGATTAANGLDAGAVLLVLEKKENLGAGMVGAVQLWELLGLWGCQDGGACIVVNCSEESSSCHFGG